MIAPVLLHRAAAEAPSGIGYFVLAAASWALTRFDGGAAFVWLATALLFAQLSVVAPARWPGALLACAVGGCLAGTIFGPGAALAPPLTLVNLGEGAASAWLLRRWLGDTAYFETPRGVAAFALVAGVIVPAAAALLGSATIAAALGQPFLHGWTTYYAAHALGMLGFAPILMLVLRGELVDWMRAAKRADWLAAVILLGQVALTAVAVFRQGTTPFLFLPALPIMAATLLLGRVGAAASIVLLTAVGGVLTMRHGGPPATAGERVQFLQFYIAATTMLVLPIAALLKQRGDLLARLTESEARHRLIAEHSGDVILNLSIEGTILYASPAMRRLGGFDPAAVVGLEAIALVAEGDRARVSETHRRALADPASDFSVEYRVPTQHGGLRWFETNMRAVADASGTPTSVISIIRDVTGHKQTEARLSAAANTDPLTGLPNRRAFMDLLDARLAQMEAGGHGTCVALFDVDWFKTVNDRHGHAAGDAVLVAFARAARDTLRERDVFARIGGEEFALILVAAPEDALTVCERLRRVLSRTAVRLDTGASITATVSAGVAVLTAASDAGDVLRAADAALYRAKAAGRDRLVVA